MRPGFTRQQWLNGGPADAPLQLAGSYQYCPTGNAPNGGSQLTPTELANLLRQFGFPFDDGNLDFFQTDGILRNSDIGRSIQPLGLSSLYALVGSDIAGAGGLALTPGERASLQQLFNTPFYGAAFIGAGGEGGAAAQSTGGARNGYGSACSRDIEGAAFGIVVGAVTVASGLRSGSSAAVYAGALTVAYGIDQIGYAVQDCSSNRQS